PPPDAATPVSKTDAASEMTAAATDSNGGEKPLKRTRKKAAKAKAAPPTGVSTETSTVPGQSVGSVSLEKHVDLAADALEKVLNDWRRASLAPLKKAASRNERILGGLGRLEKDLDGAVVRLRGYRTLAS